MARSGAFIPGFISQQTKYQAAGCMPKACNFAIFAVLLRQFENNQLKFSTMFRFLLLTLLAFAGLLMEASAQTQGWCGTSREALDLIYRLKSGDGA